MGAGSVVYRVEAANGRIQWRVPMSGRVFAPTVSDDRVFVGTEVGTVAALDIGTGKIAWSMDLEGWTYPPAASGHAVFVAGREPTLRALRQDTGAVIWETPLPNEAVYQPVSHVDAGVVTTTFSGHVMAFDPQTGRRKWSHRETIVQESPLVSGQKLVFRGFDGTITARAAHDGRVVWRLHSSTAEVRLAGDEQHVVLYGGAPAITILDARSGAELGVFATNGAPVQRAWVAAGRVRALILDGTAVQRRAIRVQQWTINTAQE